MYTSNAHSFTGTTSWVLMLRFYYIYVNGFIVKYPRKTENQILSLTIHKSPLPT